MSNVVRVLVTCTDKHNFFSQQSHILGCCTRLYILVYIPVNLNTYIDNLICIGQAVMSLCDIFTFTTDDET